MKPLHDGAYSSRFILLEDLGQEFLEQVNIVDLFSHVISYK
jgi:hypothetical protein